MRLGVQAALVDNELVPGDVAINDGAIESVGLSPAGKGGLAVPGFIDVQINGFDGIDFTTADPDDFEFVAARLASTGVTAFQPTLITLPPDNYLAALERLGATSIRSGRILGMHLEGPFLSPVRCGAHDPANMLDPDLDLTRRFLESGLVTHMTIAPELPGALGLIDLLVGSGVTVGLGHTDADAATAHAAFDRGARSVTHIFGAQRPWKHRDPGISGAALVRDDVYITAIVDGVHLAPETVQLAARCARERFVLITDAISAAGRPDGRYALGDRTVILSDGACRLENDTLAGSSLTMDQAVRNMIELGFTPLRAIAAATTAPAALVRKPELGTLAPGTPADVCVLDDSYGVVRTMVAGKETFAA
jgi:N-acetylglucosamine-6-phosphate deacetylase